MIRFKKNYFELYCENQIYGYVQIEEMDEGGEKIGNLHCSFQKFNRKIYKRFKKDSVTGLKYIKQMGFKGLIATHMNPDKTWKHFAKMFGFSEPFVCVTRRV